MREQTTPKGWNLVRLDTVLKRIKKPVDVKLDEQYREIGIRSHGKGIFYKDVRDGASLGNKSVFWVEPDCFVVNIVFAWEQAVAKTTHRENGMIASHRFPMYKPVYGKLELDYIVYFFKTPFGKHLLGLASPGGAGRNKTLGQQEFLNLSIPLPPYREQQKIAEILSTWDEAIALTERLIAALQERKKGVMQCLLTGQVRFPGYEDEWITVKLSDLGLFMKGAGVQKSDLVEEGFPCIRYGEIYTTHDYIIRKFHSFVGADVASKSQKIIADDILFAGSGETREDIGKCVAFIGPGEAYAGGDIIILRLTKGVPQFMGYLLNHETVKRQKARFGQGDSIVHIYSRYLKDITIEFPPVSEQLKIAELFESIEKEIQIHKQRLYLMQQQKKGLMQRLLTGKVRVKLS